MSHHELVLDTQEALRPGCEFCFTHEMGDNSTFTKLHGLPQLLYSNISTNLIIDTYPITEGHVMLTTKAHYFSSAQTTDQYGIAQGLEGAIDLMKKLYEGYPLVVFEHGSGQQNGEHVVACGTLCAPSNDHAHIHIVPSIHPESGDIVPIRLDQVEEEIDFLLQVSKWENFKSSDRFNRGQTPLSSRNKNFVGEKPYLHVGIFQPDGNYEEATYRQISAEDKIPSQLLRRTLTKLFYGRLVPTEVWDYHSLEWRIFVDGFKNDIPRLTEMVHKFYKRQKLLENK